MRPETGILKKDVKEFLRSKSTVFWTLAFPIMMMLFFGSIFGGGGEKAIPVAVVDLDGTNLSRSYASAMNSTGVVRLIPFSDQEEARAAAREGRDGISGLLIIPAGFQANLTSGRRAAVGFYVREGDATIKQMLTSFAAEFTLRFGEEFSRRAVEIAVSHMPENLSSGGWTMSREEAARWLEFMMRPVEAKVALLSKPEVTAEAESYWENPGHWISAMISYSYLFSGMVTSTALLAGEKEGGTLKRIRLSTASVWSVLAGKLLSALAILTLSQVVLVAAAAAFSGADVNWDPLMIPMVLAGDAASIGIGMAVAEASSNQRAASEAVVVVAIMLQFVSGLYFPIQFLPEPLRTAAELLPFAKSVEIMDAILLGGATLAEVAPGAALLAVTAAVSMAAAAALFGRWARVD